MKFVIMMYMAIGVIMTLIVIPTIVKQDEEDKYFVILLSLIFLIFLWPIGIIGSLIEKKKGEIK